MLPPRVVIAGTASGVGKTTVAVGLMAALQRAGESVAPYKVGPDYIDPSYHEVACGRPSHNLDPVLCGEDLVPPLFAAALNGASVAVIEGVMGLYDGRAATPFGSTAHVSRLLSAPVVLVVDASSMSRSVAALVHGFATFEPGVRLAGVIVNRVASPRHEALVRAALEETGVPLLGVLPRDESLSTPARHLGLVPASERSVAARETVDALSSMVASRVDLEALLVVARSAPSMSAEPWRPAPFAGERRVVALAAGPAFTFRYAANVEMLREGRRGCRVRSAGRRRVTGGDGRGRDRRRVPRVVRRAVGRQRADAACHPGWGGRRGSRLCRVRGTALSCENP